MNLNGSLKHDVLEEPFDGVALHIKVARVASQISQEDGVSAPRGTKRTQGGVTGFPENTIAGNRIKLRKKSNVASPAVCFKMHAVD